MENVTYKMQDNTLVFAFNGKISSENAAAVEEKVNEIIKAQTHENVVVDAENLEYISSAGLRVILRLKKAEPSLKVINVSADVYEIFDITGFTEIITIEKAYRKLSVEGCEAILTRIRSSRFTTMQMHWQIFIVSVSWQEEPLSLAFRQLFHMMLSKLAIHMVLYSNC